MKKNYVLTGMVLFTGLTIGTVFQNAKADAIAAPAETITIEGKKPVKFKHQIHLDLGVACGECHHNDKHQPLTKQDIGIMAADTELKCFNCHNDSFKNTKLRERKDIFHANCTDCHKKGFAGKKGPTRCADCHGKKKRAIEGC